MNDATADYVNEAENEGAPQGPYRSDTHKNSDRFTHGQQSL